MNPYAIRNTLERWNNHLIALVLIAMLLLAADAIVRGLIA